MSFISQKFKSSVDSAIDDVQSIDKTLTKLFKLEKKEAKEEADERKKKDQDRKRKARQEKRKKADDNILKKITKKKEDKETKKGLLDTLKDALGPLMGILKGVGGMLMSAVGGLGIGAMLTAALSALAPVLIGALAGIALWAAWQARAEIGKMMGGRGDTVEEQLQNNADDNRSQASKILTGVAISDSRRRMNQENKDQRTVAVEATNEYRSAMASGSGATDEEKEELRVKAEEENKKYKEGVDLLDRVVMRDNMVGQLDRIEKDLAMKDDEVPWWKHMGDVKKWRKHLERRQRELTQNVEASNQMIRDNAELYREFGIDAEILANQFTAEDGSIDLETGQTFEVRSDGTTGAIISPATDPAVPADGRDAEMDAAGIHYQNGGFVVPGHGHGDQFYTRVPQGSFVLNRNAVAAGRAMGMFQQGGAPTMQNVVLEPGEMVFGPGQWENQGIAQLNKDHKRFQEGGHVGMATEHIKKDEALSSLTPGENDYIKPGGFSVRSNTPWGDIHGDTKLHAYKDSVGVSTIGWGNTYYDSIRAGKKPVKMGDTITKSKADNIMLTNVGALARDYSKEIPNWSKMSDSQKAGLLSMGYNAPNFFTSDSFAPKLKKSLIAGDMSAAADNLSWGGPSAARISESQAMLRQGPQDLTQAAAPKKPAAQPKPAKETPKKGGNMFTNMVDGIKSFVGLQEGGQTPQQDVVLEPGEMVFDKATPELLALNNKYKRFQSGGLGQANHPDTGEGWSVGKDSYGRPSVLSKSAGEAFLRAMKASKGKVKTSDITSSTRSPAKNKAVGGVPNSNHLYGNALDIHGTSKVWLKENGPKYGWKNLVYSGHDGHFDFTGGGDKIVPGDGGEKTAEDATPENGSSTSADISGLLSGQTQGTGNELGKLFNMEGVSAFTTTFFSGVGDFLKNEVFSSKEGGSKNLEPTTQSQQTGSQLVEQSENAEEGSSNETVVVDLGGDQGPKGEVTMEGSLNTVPPNLPDGPTSAAAADYFFTVNMCV